MGMNNRVEWKKNNDPKVPVEHSFFLMSLTPAQLAKFGQVRSSFVLS